MFAIKADVSDPCAETFTFSAQKTMYGGKGIATGDTIFVFASENQGGPGLIATGVVTSAKAIAKRGIARQAPRVSITIRRTALAKGAWGEANSGLFPTGTMIDPETDLNFKFYRQATNKVVSISEKRRRFSADSFSGNPTPALSRTSAPCARPLPPSSRGTPRSHPRACRAG